MAWRLFRASPGGARGYFMFFQGVGGLFMVLLGLSRGPMGYFRPIQGVEAYFWALLNEVRDPSRTHLKKVGTHCEPISGPSRG